MHCAAACTMQACSACKRAQTRLSQHAEPAGGGLTRDACLGEGDSMPVNVRAQAKRNAAAMDSAAWDAMPSNGIRVATETMHVWLAPRLPPWDVQGACIWSARVASHQRVPSRSLVQEMLTPESHWPL